MLASYTSLFPMYARVKINLKQGWIYKRYRNEGRMKTQEGYPTTAKWQEKRQEDFSTSVGYNRVRQQMQSGCLVFLFHHFSIVGWSSYLFIPALFLYLLQVRSSMWLNFHEHFLPLVLFFFSLSANSLQYTSTCVLAKLVKKYFDINVHVSTASL